MLWLEKRTEYSSCIKAAAMPSHLRTRINLVRPLFMPDTLTWVGGSLFAACDLVTGPAVDFANIDQSKPTSRLSVKEEICSHAAKVTSITYELMGNFAIPDPDAVLKLT